MRSGRPWCTYLYRVFFFGLIISAPVIGCCAADAKARSCNLTVGVNLAGAEFASEVLPGLVGKDFKIPSRDRLRYYRSVGFNAIRLPVLWERLQPELNGPLDRAYVKTIRGVIEDAQVENLRVLLDLHNYARYRGVSIGSGNVDKAAFGDLWQRIAREFSDLTAIYAWGLMNEPYRTEAHWPEFAQVGVDAIRVSDRSREIYVAGESFSSAERWRRFQPRPFVTDPYDGIVYEAHVYLDPDASGKYHASDRVLPEVSLATARRRLAPFVSWLQDYKVKGAIGEYGVPASEAEWIAGIEYILDLAERECIATFAWAGGAWSPGYKLSLEPVAGEDKLITAWFRKRLAAQRQVKP